MSKYSEDSDYEWFDGDYGTLVDSMEVEVLVQEDFGSYQGDSMYLVAKDGRFGILKFGWGSCSGCDALQGCSTTDQLTELRDELYQSIQWGDRAETLRYLREHDWKGDYLGDEAQKFVPKAIDALVVDTTGAKLEELT